MTAKTNLLLLLVVFYIHANAQRYSVVIHEIMSDPQPAIGLPDAEYIELRNTSNMPILLSGWRLQTGTATSGAFPAYTLAPDSLVVITSRTNAALFGSNTLGVASFPALPNTGALLVLRNAAGVAVHTVAYHTAWYGNAVKAEGGWSLEMIDATNPCGGTNWKAAQHSAGGTPGRANSVQAPNQDVTPPALLAATAPDSMHLLLQFNEPLDSAIAANVLHYRLEPQLPIAAATPQEPLFQKVLLRLHAPIQTGILHQISASALADCAGNTIGSRNTVPAGLPQTAAKNDVVINEVLFDPTPDGADYVELYNRSKKIIDLSKLWVGNSSFSAAASSQPQRVAQEPLYLFPGRYVVITENRNAVLRQYLVTNEQALLEVSPMPSLPDDKGNVLLLNEQGETIDGLNYNHNWHFALISNAEGVALERIDPNGPTQQKDNWTSATASAGYGTPTYPNSQLKLQGATAGTISITPPVFSPDGDGVDDLCTISFQLMQPNYVANLRIYDSNGRPVRYLVQNQTLSQNGFWRWDGLNDGRQVLPTGTYILLLELFNLQGKKEQIKRTVVLARTRN